MDEIVMDDLEVALPAAPEQMSEDEIGAIVARAVEDAIDFIESDISPDRITAQKYFNGGVDLEFEDGRSRVVATKVRDTVRAIKPSLMRVFLSSSKFVEFTPRGPEDVPFAEQATAFLHWKFQSLGGFRLLRDAFHDALIKKTGILKVFWEEVDTSQIYTFTGLDDMQYQAVIMDPDVEVIEHTATVSAGAVVTPGAMDLQPPTSTHDMKVIRRSSRGDIAVLAVPPEEFFVDRNARSIEQCYVCGHRTDMRAGDVIAMGYSEDVVYSLDSGNEVTNLTISEREERQGYPVNPDEDESALDPAMRNVLITEAYMRMDVDGTGTPVLHRFVLGGTSYQLLSYEAADEVPFAVFEIDPEPHTFFGRGIADLVKEDQDVTTSILRGILDNVAMTNNPRLAVVRGRVEMDDVLNNEIGAIVRMDAPGMVQSLDVPFTAGQTMGALQYMDQLVEQKTGVTRASMGLDPDALQSTTKAAVTATVQAAAGQVEVMARNLAESGMRQLFSRMLRLMVKHADSQTMMRLNGTFAPVDPRVWDTSMDLEVNVGLGTGREEEKSAAYREILGLQMQIYQGYGPANGVVTLTNIRNTLSDMAASAGIRNSERYFAPMDPQREQQMLQQQQQAAAQQPQMPDPNAALLQAEQMKAQAKMQSDMMKLQLDAQRLAMDDDRARDKMAQDLALQNAELYAKYGLQANEQQIRAEQERQRMQMMPQGGQQ